MHLSLNIDPDIVALMREEIATGERAVSTAIREASTRLKSAWRGQITGAGLGTRLARSVRFEQYPKGKPSLNAAALVWSKAPVIIGARCTRSVPTARRSVGIIRSVSAGSLSVTG